MNDKSPLEPERQPRNRRRLLAGTGAVGALAAVAAVLPGAPQAPHPIAAAEPQPAQEPGGGYQLTEHVQRYYQTARV